MDQVDNKEGIQAALVEDSLKTKHRKINRRTILKAFGLVFSGAVLSMAPDTEGNTFGGRILTQIATSGISFAQRGESSKTEQSMIDETHEKENPNYRPYLEILQSGIDEFKSKNSQTPVIWQKDNQYLSDYGFFNLLVKPIELDEVTSLSDKRDFVGKTPLQLLPQIKANDDNTFDDKSYLLSRVFYNRLPDNVRIALETAESGTAVLPGTELYLAHNIPTYSGIFSHKSVPEKDVASYYEQMKVDLENEFDKSKPELLSTSKLVVYFLEKNKGNLKASLGDLSGFMEYMIRGYNATSGQIDWVRTHIQDEINKRFSLNNTPSQDNMAGDQNKDAITSIWGEFYHLPTLVYLLAYISPEMIRGAGTYEYFGHPHIAGAYKENVDNQVLDNLNDIFAYLQTFSKQ